MKYPANDVCVDRQAECNLTPQLFHSGVLTSWPHSQAMEIRMQSDSQQTALSSLDCTRNPKVLSEALYHCAPYRDILDMH